MPNIRSAKKAFRQSLRRRAENLTVKKKVKDTIKNYKKAIIAGNIEEAKTQLPTVYKTLDKAAKKNVIKENKASRLKARLTKKLSAAPEAKTKETKARKAK